ncbi:MAG TPA: HlyD family efflux transporter periplasmic adaptor subunit [Methylomirabilota bacterium]|nr:HlyD family efflux transporter periplasmic adaptor subunit [Methylomirabilota bacterium]
MDIARPDQARKKRRKRILLSVVTVLVLGLVTVGLAQLKPAAPTVEKASIWTDTVKQGQMLRQVRGNGSLVPEQIQFVQVETDGRVERILVLPGAEVKADTVLLELSNPQLKQDVFDAEWQLRGAEAQLTKLKVQLESERLTQKSLIASLNADLAQSRLEAEADENLAKKGLVASLTSKRSRARADELASRLEIEQERLRISEDSVKAQVAVQDAELEKIRALLALKRRQFKALHVTAGTDGVLQQIGDTVMLQVGQRVTPSATLAKIVQPTKLKAEIKIAETQARDILIGQLASIDTRNGVIPGRVVRVDPSVQNGTVTVDVKLEGELPRGARPDLSVDGMIELERLDNVLFVGRPVQGQPESTIGIFKVIEAGRYAVRTSVKLGRTSVSTIEVLQGLQVGDQVILSDMSAWDNHERVKLN